MKKIIFTILFLLPSTAFAVPNYIFNTTILPETNNARDLGTSTSISGSVRWWRNIFYRGNLVNDQMSNGCASWASGILTSLGVACGSGGGGAFPFITTTNFNQTANSTTTQAWFRGSPYSLSASTTAAFNDIELYGTLSGPGTVSANIVLLSDTANNLSAIIPDLGQPTYETDTKYVRVGDAVLTNTNLPRINPWTQVSNGVPIRTKNLTDHVLISSNSTATTTNSRVEIIGGSSDDYAAYFSDSAGANFAAIGDSLSGNGFVAIGANNGIDMSCTNSATCSGGVFSGGLYGVNVIAGTHNYFSGNVGIGSTTPGAKLGVTGVGTGTGRAFQVANSSNIPKFTILDNGLVGIGTTSPYAPLSVFGQAVASYFTATSTSNASTFPYASTTALSASSLTSGNCVQASTGGLLTTIGSACGSGGASPDWNQQLNYGVFTLTPTTTIPVWFKDQVFASSSAVIAGNVRASNFTATSTTVASTLPYASTTVLSSTGNAYFATTAGNVGIGSSTPLFPLSITTAGVTTLELQSTATAGSRNTALNFRNATAGGIDPAGQINWFAANDTPLAQMAVTTGASAVSGSWQLLTNSSSGLIPVLSIDQNRKTGIGTTSPVAELSISNRLTIYPTLVLDALSGSTEAIFNAQLASTSKFMVASNGRVGVSSSTPFAQLGVKGAGTGTGNALMVTDSSDVPRFTLTDQGIFTFAPNTTGNVFNLSTSGGAKTTATFANSGETMALRVSYAGGGGGLLELLGLSGSANVFGLTTFGSAALLGTPNGGQLLIGNTNNTDIVFGANTTELMRIKGGTTLIGIGSSTPFAQLQVASTSVGTAGMYGQLALTDTGAGLNLKHFLFLNQKGKFTISTSTDKFATSTVPAFTIDSNANVGIATSSPWRTLSVAGTAGFDALNWGVGSSTCISNTKELVTCDSPANTADLTITNTTASSTLFRVQDNYITRTFPANSLSPGRRICFSISGTYSLPVTGGSVVVRMVLGTGAASTTVAQLTTSSLAGSANNNPFEGSGCMTVRSVGTAGTVRGDGLATYLTTGVTSVTDYAKGTATVNTTLAQTFDITATFDTADAAKVITVTQADITIK